MKRWAVILVCGLSALASVLSAMAWRRSERAVDEVYGRFRTTFFCVESLRGVCTARVYWRYRLRADDPAARLAEPEEDPVFVADPLAHLDPLPSDGSFLTRQRYPIAMSWQVYSHPPLLPGVRYRAWLAFAREGPDRYDVVKSLSVSYWVACAAGAVPTVLLIGARLRRRHGRAAGTCVDCGYDLRASPKRCPECGRSVGVG